MAISRREMEFLIRFRADASQALNQMRTQLQGAATAATNLNRTMAQTGRQATQAMTQASNSAKQAHGSFNNLTGVMHQLRGALVTLGVAAFTKNLTEMARASDRLNAKFKFTFQTSNEVANQLSFVRKESDRLGLNFVETANQFGSFAAASASTGLELKQVQDIFLGVAEAGTALQLSGDQMQGTFFAIQQMMSKGKVNAEEFRLQLAERLPVALTAATRATGLTTKEFTKMLEKGKLISKDFLPKFAAELRKMAAGSLADSVKSLNAEFGRFSNTINSFLMIIATSGYNDGLKNLLRSINEASPSLDRLGQSIGKILKVVLDFAASVVDFVVWMDKATNGISTMGIAAGAAFVAMSAVARVFGLVTGLGGSMARALALVSSGTASVSTSSAALSGVFGVIASSASGFLSLLLRLAPAAAAAAAAFGILSNVGTEYQGVFISLGDVIGYVITNLGSMFYDFIAVTLPKWIDSTATAMVGNYEVFSNGATMIEGLLATLADVTWANYYDTIMIGWGYTVASMLTSLQFLANQADYYLSAATLSVLKLGNEIRGSLPTWLGGGQKLIFDEKELLPKKKTFEDFYKEIGALADEATGKGITNTNYSQRDGKDIMGYLASPDTLGAIAKQKKEAAALAEELARAKQAQNEVFTGFGANVSGADGEEVSKKLQREREKIREQLDKLRDETKFMMPESQKLLADFDNEYKEIMKIYEEAGKKGVKLTEQDLKTKQKLYEQYAAKRVEVERKAAQMASEELIEKLRRSKDVTDQARAALEQLRQDAQFKTGEMADFFLSAFDKASDALADFVTTGKLNISDLANWAAKELAKIAIKDLFLSGTSAIGSKSSSGGGFSLAGIGSFLANIFHEGGVVGQGTRMRPVNPMIFAGAPRLHSGLRPDEFPAILQRGETVIPRGGTQGAFMGGGNISVPINVNVNYSGGGNGSGNTTADDAQKMGAIIADSVSSKFYTLLDKEQKPGGRLAGTRGGY